jgi:hypothetical protein
MNIEKITISMPTAPVQDTYDISKKNNLKYEIRNNSFKDSQMPLTRKYLVHTGTNAY